MVAIVTGANSGIEYFYKCRIVKSSKASKDEEVARKLFELSAEMTGLNDK